jgi:predicted CDP-diglyceride synthetase/phosphatidate cytidylyltransferase
MFRQPAISFLVVLGILAVTFAVADHWYGLFVAITPLLIGIMAAVAIWDDQPKGYIQRVALGAFAFLLFGMCFGHLAYFANGYSISVHTPLAHPLRRTERCLRLHCRQDAGPQKVGPKYEP